MSSVSTNESQTNDNVPIQLTNATGTYMQDFNEDCLLEIFSNNSLTPMDLCSLAETCKRFKRISQRLFPKDFGLLAYWNHRERATTYEFKSNSYQWPSFSQQNVARILRSFGSHLATLRLYEDLAIVNLEAKYCDDVTLKRFEMFRLNSIESVRIQLNSMFERLQELYVHKCDLPAYPDIDCVSLIELRLENSHGSVAILKKTFPNLKRFTWTYLRMCRQSEVGGKNAVLFKFIRRHGHLTTINVKDETIRVSNLLHVIDRSCKELKELRLPVLDNRKKTPIDRSKLQGNWMSNCKLEELDIELGVNNYRLYLDLLQSAKSLKTLKLCLLNVELVQIFDVLSQLRNLSELTLHCFDTRYVPWSMLVQLRKVHLWFDFHSSYGNFLNIITELTNLEELIHTGSVFNFTEEQFAEIAKVVERRPHVLTLNFYSELANNFDKNCKVKLLNQNKNV